MSFFQNIKVKLTLWYFLITAIVIVFFSSVAYLILSDSLSRMKIDPWDMLIAQIENTPGGNSIVTGFVDIGQKTGIDYEDKIIVIRGFSVLELLESATNNGIIQIDITQEKSISIDKYLLSDSVMTKDSQIWLYLFLSQDNPDNYQLLIFNRSPSSAILTIGVFKKALIITVLVTLVLAGVLGFFLVRRMLKPLHNITKTAQEIEEKDLSKRFKVANYDELGKLAITLNHMFERLENAFKRERQFTADASHELRTPLAIIQGEATLTLQRERTIADYKKSLITISQESEHMLTILKKLLFLARTESDKSSEHEEVNLKEFLDDIVMDTEALYNKKSMKVDVISKDDIVVKGDRPSLRVMFLNIIDNAIRYTSPGGEIKIIISRKENNACIAIKDSGIGIPEEQIGHIFDRFYRVDKSLSHDEGGSGLGLAISQRISEIHNGKIEAISKIGQGSVFTVYLPLYENE